MQRILFIITLIIATLATDLLSAGFSFRIGGGRSHRDSYYRHHPYRYRHQRYYRQNPRYRNRYYRGYQHYCYPEGCFRYGYVTESYVGEVVHKKDHVRLKLDNGMVFQIRKTKRNFLNKHIEVYVKESPSGWSLGIQGDDFGFRFGERSSDLNYRLVIKGYEYQAKRLE